MSKQTLIGVTLISNGDKFNYPWRECIGSMHLVCDKTYVSLNKNSEDCIKEVRFCQNIGTISVLSKWNMQNTGDGQELAIRINNLLPLIDSENKEDKDNTWILYLQGDELIHEKDMNELRGLINHLDKMDKSINEIELFRTYFWGDLETRAPKFEINLGRVFRMNTHIVGGDGMYILPIGPKKVYRSGIDIFHYSRIGDEKIVNRRLRNLDTLFHPLEEVNKFRPFTYQEIEDSELIRYNGTHPKGIKEFYSE